MALATSILVATGLGIAAGVGGMMLLSGDKDKPQTPTMQMPTAPKAPKQADQAKLAQQSALARQKAAARSQSVKTNPLGIKDEATVARKKLLGG